MSDAKAGPTLRTDALSGQHDHSTLLNFARNLERELAAKSAELEKAGRPVSSIDYQQRIGRHHDIIIEAINAYNQYMVNDDFDAQGNLDSIIKRMRERLAMSAESALAEAQQGKPQTVKVDRTEELERALATKLRDYADNPCSLGYVPMFPKTLRQIAHVLEGDIEAARQLLAERPTKEE